MRCVCLERTYKGSSPYSKPQKIFMLMDFLNNENLK